MNFLNVTLRKALKGDVSAVYDMVSALEGVELDKEAFYKVFHLNVVSSNITYFIAEKDAEPLGMISCHIQPLLHHAALVAEIQEMFVFPAYRSLGIGHLLMEHTIAYVKQQGVLQLEVTSRRTRKDAHRFYEREGFQNTHVKLIRYFND